MLILGMLIADRPTFSIQQSTFLGGAAIRIQSVPLWAWWIPLVWAISLPWAGLTKDPQWSRVHPVPFTDPADRPRDLIANIALYIPFGYSLARRRRWPLVVGVATGVSLVAEATQLFGTVRYPSATDVTAAVIGATIGAAWRALAARQR
jgi:glycopeptide antibiotics resistance protein